MERSQPSAMMYEALEPTAYPLLALPSHIVSEPSSASRQTLLSSL